jgi:hypothetical protein
MAKMGVASHPHWHKEVAQATPSFLFLFKKKKWGI